MFGGLTKTSSRIAIAAALGLTLGGFAFKATPAQAADLGGDCCADLEERVAELEATTVRKGNKKVSVTLSGWVVKTMNFGTTGTSTTSSSATRTTTLALASRSPAARDLARLVRWFQDHGQLPGRRSSASVSRTRSMTFKAPFGDINTLYSYIYIKSDKLGALNWGHLSPASDNAAVLADMSGTVIESNAVFFEGGGLFLRPERRSATG